MDYGERFVEDKQLVLWLQWYVNNFSRILEVNGAHIIIATNTKA